MQKTPSGYQAISTKYQHEKMPSNHQKFFKNYEGGKTFGDH